MLVCLAGGVLMGLIATCLAEVGSRFTRTAGVYVYVTEGFGDKPGLVVNVLTVVSRLPSFAGTALSCSLRWRWCPTSRTPNAPSSKER